MVELDAINVCLRYLGETPVPEGVDIDSLDDLHEAKIIREMLHSKSQELQADGWWFNKETWTFIPDTQGKISIPPTVLALYSEDNVIQRGGSLYDRDNQTYEFTDSQEAETVFAWNFEDLPHNFANWTTLWTAKEVQVFLNGDDFTDASLQKSLYLAKAKVDKEQMRHLGANLISGGRLVDRTTNPTAIS